VVHPWQSIQVAVDRAASGDTIKLDAGNWTEAVCINRKGLSIVGAGADATRIVWPDWGPGKAPPKVAPTPCWDAWASADPETSKGNQDDVSALFFLNPDGPVLVTGLQTRNHPANGIVAWNAHGFRVSGTKGYAHDRYGILAANSTNSQIVGNVEAGRDRGTPTSPNSGTAGIGIADSANANAQVANNWVEGYNLGIFAREARNGQILGNTVTRNCVGVNIFDDGNVEVPPRVTRNIGGGQWTVVGNRSIANNRFCLAGIGAVQGKLRVSGIGMAVVNADTVLVKNNLIKDNAPSVAPPLDFPPGGLTLITLRLSNTSAPNAAGPITNVQVVGNNLRNNLPWDILFGPPPQSGLPAAGPNVTFSGNSCTRSHPPGTAGCGGAS
jgi:hypothetical protein